MNVLILAAVPAEIQSLVYILNPEKSFYFLDETFHALRRGNGAGIIVGTTGLGKANAAVVTSAALQRFPVRQVWSIGCAGAYAEGPLSMGDVLIAKEVLVGDEGVLGAGGPLSTREIGIPILRRGDELFFDSIPLWAQPIYGKLTRQVPEGLYEGDRGLPPPHGENASSTPSPFKVCHGPSLTVSMASGDSQTAAARFRRFGAYAENMEGSGVAQACFRHGVPMMECRGMSNVAGDRDKTRWDFPTAFAHCHTVVLQWLAALGMVERNKAGDVHPTPLTP